MAIVEKNIGDFKNGDNVQGYFYIKESELKTTTTNNKYMNFTLSDKTGDVNAKLWDWDEDNVKRFQKGIIVKVRGQVIEWQGQPQLKIELIRRTNADDKVRIEDYIPSSPENGENMLAFIENVVSSMSDNELKTLVSEILYHFHDKILIFPAAKKNHHSVRSGLLFHTSTMLRSAIALSGVYTFLNKDLLFAGVILHDIGKIEEMEISEYGIVNEYSTDGILLGHIIQGIKTIEKFSEKLGISKEKSMLLEHMILSHHYLPEHGSPKFPHFPEAEILHYLDVMDARMYDMEKAQSVTEPGEFSDRIWSLENRAIYKPTF